MPSKLFSPVMGSYLKKHALEFPSIIRERNNRARRLCSSNVPDEKETLEYQVEQFCNNVKIPFLKDLMNEINVALKTDDEVILVFNVFNTKTKLTEDESCGKIEVLKFFYGSSESSLFENKRAKTNPLVNIEDNTIQ